MVFERASTTSGWRSVDEPGELRARFAIKSGVAINGRLLGLFSTRIDLSSLAVGSSFEDACAGRTSSSARALDGSGEADERAERRPVPGETSTSTDFLPLPAGLPFQARVSNGKRRASHSEVVSGHTSPGEPGPVEGTTGVTVSTGALADSAFGPATAPAAGHHDGRLGARVSLPSEPVQTDEDKLRRSGKPAQPGTPGSATKSDKNTSPTSGGRLMAFPPAAASSSLSLFPLGSANRSGSASALECIG
jgi:hypothetical protein